MTLHLTPEQLIFWEYDAHGLGVAREEFGDLHSIFLFIHERKGGSSPDDEVLELLKDPMNIWMRNAIPQGEKLLAMPNFPWRYIKNAANIDGKELETEGGVRTWLESMLQLIQKNLTPEPVEKNAESPK